MCRIKNITQGFLILWILNQFELILGDLILLYVLFNLINSTILGGVIDVNHMIVCVLLLEDRIQVLENVVVAVVLVAGNDHTERKLFIKLFVWLFVFLLVVLDLLEDHGVDLRLLLLACWIMLPAIMISIVSILDDKLFLFWVIIVHDLDEVFCHRVLLLCDQSVSCSVNGLFVFSFLSLLHPVQLNQDRIV